MDIAEAEVMVKELWADFEQQLPGWRWAFETHYVQAGSCHFERRVVSISRQMAQLNGWLEVRETLLHEIAHALVGPGPEAHGLEWTRTALSIGSTGARTHQALMPPKQWMRRCEGCGSIRERKEALYEAARSKTWRTGCCETGCYWENDRTGEIRRCGA